MEVFFEDRWISLEGLILDRDYLEGVKNVAPQTGRSYCGYGVAAGDINAPGIQWTGKDTFIQRLSISGDLGVYNDPDSFFAEHGENLSGLRKFLFKHIARKWMNARVRSIRRQGRGSLVG